MKKLQNTPTWLKLILTTLFFFGFYFGLHSEHTWAGYISLFLGLGILFEGFGFSLLIKILIALFLGVILSLLSIKQGLFTPESLVAIKPIGSVLFMNALTMALVPLVFASILTGITNLGDLSRLNRIGTRTIAYYIITTAVAISIGLGVANIMQPGQNIDPEVKTTFQQKYSGSAEQTVSKATKNQRNLFETLLDIVPKNILTSISLKRPHMLQLIFFAIISGIALLQIPKNKAAPVISFFEGITDMTVQIIVMIMRIAPYGVFALIVAAIAQTESLELIWSLIPFSICVLIGLFLHVVLITGISVSLFSKRNYIQFFKSIREVLITAFSTASSGGTMPFTLKTTQNELGVKKEVASFVIPLGATINMDGTALYQGVSALFLANIYGISLTFPDQLTVIAMAVMASIGTAAVPGVGIVILTMILVSVGIPAEGILFLMPVNNLLDMFRTAVNVTGDMACSIYVDHKESSN